MNISEIKEKYKIIGETYNFMAITSFEPRNLKFDKLITCLKHGRRFIPVFIKFSLVEKRYINSRFIPMVQQNDDDVVYESGSNLVDNVYSYHGGSILIVSNNLSELSKIKLTI